jgi:anaerobic selenocysteine-containing dehydrogenase
MANRRRAGLAGRGHPYADSGNVLRLARRGLWPLTVSIDPFINESSTFADHIVPNAVLYGT